MATGLRGTGGEIVDPQVVDRAAGRSLEDVDGTQLVICSLYPLGDDVEAMIEAFETVTV